MSLCKACIQGVRHEGTPTGKIETIGGVKSYVATPSVDYPKDKVLLFLPDIFGIELQNSQLLADDFAANGFKTIIPDYFHGDAIPESALGPGKTFDWAAWLAKGHDQAGTRPHLDAVIAALKEEGITTFGATGYCFGGRYSVDLAIENVTKVIVISHPSMLQVPEDFETLKEKSNNPILVVCNEDDMMYPPEKAEIVDGILGGGKYAPGYVKDYYAGCSHGFATRGDLSNPVVKAAKESAFKSAVEFFIKHL